MASLIDSTEKELYSFRRPAELIDERRILLKELPIVRAYPFSSGSAVTVVKDLSSLLCMLSLLGLIKSFQL